MENKTIEASRVFLQIVLIAALIISGINDLSGYNSTLSGIARNIQSFIGQTNDASLLITGIGAIVLAIILILLLFLKPASGIFMILGVLVLGVYIFKIVYFAFIKGNVQANELSWWKFIVQEIMMLAALLVAVNR